MAPRAGAEADEDAMDEDEDGGGEASPALMPRQLPFELAAVGGGAGCPGFSG